MAPVTLVTEGLPVALIAITRCWSPTLGVARHTVRLAAVDPTPLGWKSMLVTFPLSRKPLGNGPRLNIAAPPASTIQPLLQLPPQLVPLVEAHSVTIALRLIASLRASWVLDTNLLAIVLSLLPSMASLNAGTAIVASMAAMATVIMSSVSVKPRWLTR